MSQYMGQVMQTGLSDRIELWQREAEKGRQREGQGTDIPRSMSNRLARAVTLQIPQAERLILLQTICWLCDEPVGIYQRNTMGIARNVVVHV